MIDTAIFALGENGKLTIKISNVNNDLKVNIIDNGSGIPQDVISRVFDPFFTTKKVGEGTGYGLDLASRFIKRHNGIIKATSVPGRTEFSISIPGTRKLIKRN